MPVQSIWLGIEAYTTVLDKQMHAHQMVLQGSSECIFGVEHPPVITLGKRGGLVYENNPVPVVQINRGGLATAHELGQLTIYPIIHLDKRNMKIRRFVCTLEQCVIDWLRGYQLDAGRRKDPGIWIEEQKICSIGLQIKNGVSLHGLSINIHNSLETFLHIEACGLPKSPMGTLRTFLPSSPSCKSAFQALSAILVDRIENS
ncbi:MAG: lipoyl(octanoyl) transferase LipB [Myxococcota bacterium]|nr:lipoyl(octanoyl) transferase LipB [Myxococcota bacterium]